MQERAIEAYHPKFQTFFFFWIETTFFLNEIINSEILYAVKYKKIQPTMYMNANVRVVENTL